MDPTGVVRRVINRPRDVIPRNPAMNPDVKNSLLNYIIPLYLVFSQTLLDVPDFNFTYNDSDILHAEISGKYMKLRIER